MTGELKRKILDIVDDEVGDFKFEINDEVVRNLIKTNIEMAIEDKCSFDFKLNKITGFEVICNSTNNNNIDIDAGRINIYVHISMEEEKICEE